MLLKYTVGDLHISNFVSSRCYKTKEDGLFAYIYNSLTKEMLILKGESAKIWQLLLNSADNRTLFFEAKKLGVEDEIDNFLFELKKSGLIGHCDNNFNKVKVEEITDQAHEEFFSEFTNWGIKHNLLLTLTLELTYKCNLRCIHCFNHKNNNRNEITFEEAKKIIDSAYNLGLFRVTLTGGESTLAKDFLKIAQYIKSKHLSLSILTNTQTLYDNKELLSEIIKLRPASLEISLYSMRSEIHDKITQTAGSLEKTLYVIQKLKEADINIFTKIFLTKYNIEYANEVVKFARENKINLNYDEIFIYNKENNNAYVQVTDEQLEDFLKENLLEYETRKDINQEPCKAGHASLSITPDLNVNLCPSFEYTVGNLQKNSLEEIWNDSNQNSLLNEYRKFKLSDIKECFNENYCKYCNYCPGRSFFEHKEISKTTSQCRSARIKMSVMKQSKNA